MKTKKKKQIPLSETKQAAIIEQLKWSQPAGLKIWAEIFGRHRNTMRKWLDHQTIRNEHMSPRLWRVAIEELPTELVLSVLTESQPQEKEMGKLPQEERLGLETIPLKGR